MLAVVVTGVLGPRARAPARGGLGEAFDDGWGHLTITTRHTMLSGMRTPEGAPTCWRPLSVVGRYPCSPVSLMPGQVAR
jgi:hypothetical protein